MIEDKAHVYLATGFTDLQLTSHNILCYGCVNVEICKIKLSYNQYSSIIMIMIITFLFIF